MNQETSVIRLMKNRKYTSVYKNEQFSSLRTLSFALGLPLYRLYYRISKLPVGTHTFTVGNEAIELTVLSE